MPVIPFGEFLPDRADLGNPGTVSVKNALPTASGYAPVKDVTTTTNALTNRPRGAITVKDTAGVVYQFAGDETKLYERSDQTWNDQSKVGGYSTSSEDVWEFVQWKNKVLATNFADDPQQITLGGTIFSDLTTAFKAKHIAVIRDQVVFGYTEDGTDGEVGNRVRWSAIDDETDYTVSQSTLSDFQDIKSGGTVRRVVGGEYGVIFMDNSVWRMTFVGPPVAYQFDEVLPGIGTFAPNSIVRDGDAIYFLTERGFFVLVNGTQARPIGDTKVDRFVLDDVDKTQIHRMTAALDVSTRRIYWAYPGSGSTSGRPNKIIVYDQTLDRWSYIEKDVELLFRAAGVSTTLEGLDSISSSLDALPASLDSAQWLGGIGALGVFDENFKSGGFDGDPMTAVLTTKETEIHEGRKTRLKAFRPLIDGGTVTAKIGARDRQSDAPTFTASITQSSSGRFTKRSNARFHRFQITASGDWTDAIGVQVIPREATPGEFRG